MIIVFLRFNFVHSLLGLVFHAKFLIVSKHILQDIAVLLISH